MAQDRVVKVTLTAQMQNYLAGMEKARKVTAEAASEADKLAKTKQAFDQLGRASLLAGGLLATGLGVAVKRFADFDAAMSNVAATGEDARENMDALREAAIQAGADTVFSAEESANAIENLAKAGLSASDILGGALAGSLDLAAAGGIDVAKAGEIAATTLQQFGLSGADAVHVADLLAAGAGKAMGDVDDMAQALNQAGLVANQFGISVEETTGSLAAFANQGLLGSDAGTSLRTMLLRLANPTGEVKDLMAELGIEAYDAGGQFVGLQGLAGELEDALAGMTDEQRQATLAMIFGQDAIRAATILYDEGADGIASWIEKVDQSGYAAESAARMVDNLKGDIEGLQGSVDAAMISVGSAADGPLRMFVQTLDGLVDRFNGMPEAAKQALFWVGSFGAVGATALGSYLLLVPKVAEFNAALTHLSPAAARAARGVGMLARQGALVAAVAGGVTLATEAVVQGARDLRGTDDAIAAALTTPQTLTATLEELGLTADATKESVTKALDAIGSGNILGGVGMDILTLRDGLADLDADITSLPIDAMAAKFRQWSTELGLTEEQAATLLNEMPNLKDAVRDHLTVTGESADAQDLLNFLLEEQVDVVQENESALRAMAGQAEATGDEVEGLADQIRNFGQATLDTRAAERQFEQAIDDLTESVKENGTVLDLNEQKGRDNQAAIDDLAESVLDYAAAIYEQTGSQEEATRVLEIGRQKLIDMLGQFGITGDAAEAYADDLGLIPENVRTYVDLNTTDATNRLNELIRMYDGRQIRLQLTANQVQLGDRVFGGLRDGRASGGAIYGPGSGTSDSAGLFPLSNGEHVLTAEDVRAMGGQNAVYAFRSALHSGGGGAPVSTAPPVVYVQNPWGPEYMEAQVAGVADSRIAQRDRIDNAGIRRRFV